MWFVVIIFSERYEEGAAYQMSSFMEYSEPKFSLVPSIINPFVINLEAAWLEYLKASCVIFHFLIELFKVHKYVPCL